MDEIACPDRISSGDIICVDCCGMLTGDGDYECPIGHDTFQNLDSWFMEIYSAYDEPERFPDDASVLDALPASFRMTVEDAGGPVAYLERRHGMTIYDPRRPAIPDPFRCAINRRAV
jgi:hypothetical protein